MSQESYGSHKVLEEQKGYHYYHLVIKLEFFLQNVVTTDLVLWYLNSGQHWTLMVRPY